MAFCYKIRWEYDGGAVMSTELIFDMWSPEYQEDLYQTYKILRDDFPVYDPSPQPATINDTPIQTKTEIKAIKAWLQQNMANVRWNQVRWRYQITSS